LIPEVSWNRSSAGLDKQQVNWVGSPSGEAFVEVDEDDQKLYAQTWSSFVI